LLLDPPAALKLQINKKDFCKAALNYCDNRIQYRVHLNIVECSNNVEKFLCPAFAGRQVWADSPILLLGKFIF